MKIVGFAQLRNELSKGNLENWFRSMEFCDEIYIYDQNSDDGSKEYYKRFDNIYLIESSFNNFQNEIECKDELLEKLLKEQPDTNWIFWMDGDTILDGRLTKEKIYELLKEKEDYDSIILGHLNLWRSDTFYRIDSLFHWLNEKGVVAFWKNNGKLKYNPRGGLHNYQFPSGTEKGYRVGYYLIHKGFSTDEQILNRIDHYLGLPLEVWQQKGEWVLKPEKYRQQTIDRFLGEENLDIKPLPIDFLPDWFEIKDDIDPKTKVRLRQIYEKRS